MNTAALHSSEHLKAQADRARQDRNRQLLLAALVAITLFAVLA